MLVGGMVMAKTMNYGNAKNVKPLLKICTNLLITEENDRTPAKQ
jgi:hypothetical protein